MPSGAVMLGDGAHHGHGADGEHEVDLAPGGDQFVELLGHQALFAVAAVVGHDVGLVAGLAHFVFKDHHLFAARAFNKDDVVAGLLEGVGGGQRHGRAHAAGQNDRRAVVLNLRRVAERADDVEDGVARLKAVQQRGGFADGLHHDGDGARLRIGALDGERNALALFMQAEE